MRIAIKVCRNATMSLCQSTTRQTGRRLPAACQFSTTTTNHEFPSDNDNDSTASSSSLRTRLLKSALKHVPEHGWTMQAIVAAVRQDCPQVSLSYATTLTEHDLVQFFMDESNQQLKQALIEQQDEKNESNPLVDRIHVAFQLRLEMVAQYIRMGRWHQGMALGVSDPASAWTTSEQLQDLVAIVTRYTSADRPLSELAQFGLGAIYVATECHMLADDSENYQATWDFLRAQLQQWDALQSHSSEIMPNLESAAFLASTLATALLHGIASVSNLPRPPPMPTPDQLWETAMGAMNPTAARTSSTSASMPTVDREPPKPTSL